LDGNNSGDSIIFSESSGGDIIIVGIPYASKFSLSFSLFLSSTSKFS
jgi:hypothetical protein